jgi:hypothetical protein
VGPRRRREEVLWACRVVSAGKVGFKVVLRKKVGKRGNSAEFFIGIFLRKLMDGNIFYGNILWDIIKSKNFCGSLGGKFVLLLLLDNISCIFFIKFVKLIILLFLFTL